MLKAQIRSPGALSASIAATCALSASIAQAQAQPHRPATRERLGEVVVGDGLDVDVAGTLSVSADVRDYENLANRPTIGGEPLSGEIGLTVATDADIDAMFA